LVDHWKARGLDLSPILTRPQPADHILKLCVPRDLGAKPAPPPDQDLIAAARPALEKGAPVTIDLAITNVRRTLGTRLSHEVARRYGEDGLAPDTITIRANGSGGQSFFAFGAPGITVQVSGDANDYFGKGLSGATLAIRPPETADFAAEKNIIIGNVALYGATAGQAYIRGLAGERFAVRNSGAEAVVEGVGDHGCEYMTGGRVAVIGPTGRNFAAGMSGGVAFVLEDDAGRFRAWNCNRETVDLDPLGAEDEAALKAMLESHLKLTASLVAGNILDQWAQFRTQFIKVMPKEYKAALERLKGESEDG
jgi:glutamate synthase domain-containing protein 3